MKIRFAGFACMLIAFFACSVCVPTLMAQEKKAQKTEKKAPEQNIQGLVKTITRAASTIMVQTNEASARGVLYNAETKFSHGHSNDAQPGSVNDVKEQYFISCSGKPNDKGLLVATDCIYREKR